LTAKARKELIMAASIDYTWPRHVALKVVETEDRVLSTYLLLEREGAEAVELFAERGYIEEHPNGGRGIRWRLTDAGTKLLIQWDRERVRL
jgi:hypothetical protein